MCINILLCCGIQLDVCTLLTARTHAWLNENMYCLHILLALSCLSANVCSSGIVVWILNRLVCLCGSSELVRTCAKTSLYLLIIHHFLVKFNTCLHLQHKGYSNTLIQSNLYFYNWADEGEGPSLLKGPSVGFGTLNLSSSSLNIIAIALPLPFMWLILTETMKHLAWKTKVIQMGAL